MSCRDFLCEVTISISCNLCNLLSAGELFSMVLLPQHISIANVQHLYLYLCFSLCLCLCLCLYLQSSSSRRCDIVHGLSQSVTSFLSSSRSFIWFHSSVLPHPMMISSQTSNKQHFPLSSVYHKWIYPSNVFLKFVPVFL